MIVRSGHHYLQIPGPAPVPDKVSHAIAEPTIDHRGPAFAELARNVLRRLPSVFGTTRPVVVYPSSATGAWEAALCNTLSPGDHVLCFETGHFATLWSAMAAGLGLDVEVVPGDWRHGVDPDVVAQRLTRDTRRRIRAVMVVHNETSTGVTSRIAEIRRAIDATGHDALYLVDTVSSLASMDYRHDEWGVDVTVAGSQKGLMLPPGLGFNAVSAKALAAAERARLPKSYWAWQPILAANRDGFFPYTPATNLLNGLRVALDLLEREGHARFSRHARHADAVRLAVRGWGLEVLALDPAEYSNTVTAVLVPDDVDADEVRRIALERYDMSLGVGLGRLAGHVFRIGHLGWTNDLTILAALAGVQLGLRLTGLKVPSDGWEAAVDRLAQQD
jgi:alanine-glyoxylate transaminase/serine-glyoxylate transaminase/serine-pyruvate transaminase